MNDKQDTPIETGSKLAYTTKTGDEPKSRLAAIAADKEAPVIDVATPRRIAKKTVKKRTPRVSAPPSTALTHIKVDSRVLTAAKRVIDNKENTYSRFDIVDNETVIVR